ncbi:Fic family protein [Alicycliphilus sp. T452]
MSPPADTANPPASPHLLLRALRGAGLQGASVAQLLAQLPGIPRRTAQRWLAQCVEAGQARAIGAGRGRRYVAVRAMPLPAAVHQVRESAAPPWSTDDLPGSLALSPEGREVWAYVSQPLTARAPVGYQRDWIDGYVPGRTFYLPEPVRRQLHAMGRTPDEQAPAGTYSRAVLDRLLIDLSWASSHLEGNTYSRLDTRELIRHGTAAEGKARVETQMILNHKAAIELLVDASAQPGPPFSRYLLMNLHATLAENLLPNPADEGRVRQHAVDIGQSVFRPLDAPQVLDELVDVLIAKANAIADPFEQAFFMMVHLPYLQPFADINKRTSRLAANLPLFRANLCPLTFVDVPPGIYARAMLGVYEMGRVELLRDLLVWAYERSTQEYVAIRQTLAEPDPLRLAWRQLIKDTVHAVVTQPGADAVGLVEQAVAAHVPGPERAAVQALILDELRRLHEGVLARYRLRPGQWREWIAAQGGY